MIERNYISDQVTIINGGKFNQIWSLKSKLLFTIWLAQYSAQDKRTVKDIQPQQNWTAYREKKFNNKLLHGTKEPELLGSKL